MDPPTVSETHSVADEKVNVGLCPMGAKFPGEGSGLVLPLQVHLLDECPQQEVEQARCNAGVVIRVFNFARKHMTLKETPAMASGLADHVWSIRELIEESAKH